VNLLFVRRVREEFKIPRLLAVLEGHITKKIIEESMATVLFGINTDVDLWSLRLRRRIASESCWRYTLNEERTFSEAMDLPKNLTNSLVPIAVKQDIKVNPAEDGISFANGNELTLVVFHEKQNEVYTWLVEQGWEPVQSGMQ